jgi:hypothetical protein
VKFPIDVGFYSISLFLQTLQLHASLSIEFLAASFYRQPLYLYFYRHTQQQQHSTPLASNRLRDMCTLHHNRPSRLHTHPKRTEIRTHDSNRRRTAQLRTLSGRGMTALLW